MKYALLVLVLAACGDKTGNPNRPHTATTREVGLVAFETIRTVLQHPRCQNCHPSGDVPLQGDDGHPHNQNVQRGPEGRGMLGLECSTCHGAANTPDTYGLHTPPGIGTGWRMPPPSNRMVFVGVAPGALCEAIKDPARNGHRDAAALRVHLDDPLVAWGWTPGKGRAAIPIARQEFLSAFETWTAGGSPCPN